MQDQISRRDPLSFFPGSFCPGRMLANLLDFSDEPAQPVRVFRSPYGSGRLLHSTPMFPVLVFPASCPTQESFPMRLNPGTCGEVPEVHGRRFACFGFGAIGFCESKNRVLKNQDRSTLKACKKSREGPSLDIWAHRGLVWKCSALIMLSLVSNRLDSFHTNLR